MSFYKNVQHIASNVTKSHLCTVIEFFPLEIGNRNYRLCVFTDMKLWDISPPSELFLAKDRDIIFQESTLDEMCKNVSVNKKW